MENIVQKVKENVDKNTLNGVAKSFVGGFLTGTVGIGILPDFNFIMNEMTKAGYLGIGIAGFMTTKWFNRPTKMINYALNIPAMEAGYIAGCALKLMGER